MRPHIREIVDFLTAAGAESPRLENGGKHPRIVFLWRGRQRRHTIAGTLGDGYRGPKNAISELRHMLGLVEGQKRIGARRRRSRRVASVQIALPTPTASPQADWRADLSRHPVAGATLPARLDAAWWAFWREIHGPPFAARP